MESQTDRLNPPTKNPEVYEVYKAILTINEQNQNIKAKEGYWRAYFLSAILPPIGVYYFVKYFFFEENPESRKAAIISLTVTIISLTLNLNLHPRGDVALHLLYFLKRV